MSKYKLKRLTVIINKAWNDITLRFLSLLILTIIAVNAGWKYNYDVKKTSLAKTTTDNNSESDSRIADYTLWLAIGTGILAISTILLWVETRKGGIRQSRDMRKQLIIAKESADTARSALLDLESPYIHIEDVRFGTVTRVQMGDSFKSLLEYEFVIKNVGRTPTIVTWIEFELSTQNFGDPTHIKIPSWSGIVNKRMAFGAGETHQVATQRTFWRDFSEYDSLTPRRFSDIMTIFVVYEDVFGWMHFSRFKFFVSTNSTVTLSWVAINESYYRNRKSKKIQPPEKFPPDFRQYWND